MSATDAAENLLGHTLKNDWEVIEKINLPKTSTGGFFSVGYKVRNNEGKLAFLKAINFNKMSASAGIMAQIELTTKAFNFECELLDVCKNENMNKIVLSLDYGEYFVGDENLANLVPYIIFELANADIRSYKNITHGLDALWILKILHSIAIGIKQLHEVKIIHQDLKPSNVLLFDITSENKEESKISDLGRSYSENIPAPHGDSFRGDRSYAPIEYWYGYDNDKWSKSKYSIDLYLFGNLILFLFTNHNINTLIYSKLDDAYKWESWTGTYDEVKDFILAIFVECIEEIKSQILPEYIAEDIKLMIEQLCNPDPERRGHPQSILGTKSKYSLERYISILDALIYQVKLQNAILVLK